MRFVADHLYEVEHGRMAVEPDGLRPPLYKQKLFAFGYRGRGQRLKPKLVKRAGGGGKLPLAAID
jgi:hypothetical protein